MVTPSSIRSTFTRSPLSQCSSASPPTTPIRLLTKMGLSMSQRG